MSQVVAVIPARLASTRLPRKVLLDRTGMPLIQHVWRGVRASGAIGRILIATDDEEVAAAVRDFGGEAVMTSPACASGTDRVAEAARLCPEAQIIVNVQGDEPEMSPVPLNALVHGMLARPQAEMGTVAVPWPDSLDPTDPGSVKVVLDGNGDALYFSRSPIPCYRGQPPAGAPRYLRHVGLYAYRPAFLQEFAAWAPSPLEQAEGLEQLRALEHGRRIAVFVTEYEGREVNTPEDYETFVERIRRAKAI
jgi:3-deoxy-manno-octulosonate cytidylyltransferase (CMP-KDO synthetase)